MDTDPTYEELDTVEEFCNFVQSRLDMGMRLKEALRGKKAVILHFYLESKLAHISFVSRWQWDSICIGATR